MSVRNDESYSIIDINWRFYVYNYNGKSSQLTMIDCVYEKENPINMIAAPHPSSGQADSDA